ncbi:ABC transporter ATP-binding protein [Lampropedia aestuarii]|uniref:ABC transporter ATP-binding protein n=1 Tax=Lampropedia aestuarii TaxID=2562762 RepID=UPI00246875E8|nr:ATP-binding cassette domain-containing protein [Lampropedia aestuarii]MDH5858595.1 ATP-binding cassette domain-containing protein [Lampropedia aestuarii]
MKQSSTIAESPRHTPAEECPNRLEISGLQLLGNDGAPLLDIGRWQMPAGVHWVHGASGAGKTRLLRLLADLPAANHNSNTAHCSRAQPTQSSVGRPAIDWHSPPALPRPLSPKDVFFAEPEQPIWDPMTIAQVHAQLLVPTAESAGYLSVASHARMQADLLAGFGLNPHQHKAMSMLSTGTRRKVFLMAALLAPHPLVLLDEPSAALDQCSIRALYYALVVRNRIARHQVTLVATALEPHEHGQIGRGHWHLG